VRIDARVDRVTVFERGARVTRLATLKGTHGALPPRVIAAGLPLGLIDDSVRVTARGATAIAATVTLEAPGADDALPAAQPAALRDARRAAALAEGELARLRLEIAAIVEAPLVVEAPAARDQPPAPWSTVTAARRALLAMRQIRLRELRQAVTAATAHSHDCARALKAATEANQRRSDARSPRAQELRKSVVIDLQHAAGEQVADAAADGVEIELTLEYAVRGARWAPSYVARYAAGQITWTIRAQLAQQTGEDWTGVALRLSTAALDGHSALPELAALKIGKRQAAVARRLRPPPPGVDELFADFDRDLKRPAAPPAVAAPPPKPGPPGASGASGASDQPTLLASFAASPDAFQQSALDDLMQAERSDSDDTQVRSRKKSGGVLGGLARRQSNAPAPLQVMAMMSSPSAPPRGGGGGGRGEEMAKPMKTMMYGATADAGDQLGAASSFSEPEPALTAELDYVGLVMAGIGHPRRGTLVAMSLVERYRAPDSREGADSRDALEVHAVRRLLDQAKNAATRIDLLQVPAGHSADWSHDFDYALDAEGRLDVPSDGEWHSIPLLTREAAARIAHVVVPREAPDVFRTAIGVNPFDAPILPGPVDVYDGDRFLVTAAAPMAAPGGELVLPLGVDSAIKVARNAEFREEITGMLRGGLRLLHELRVEVQNTSGAAIELEVRERIPVPRQRDSDDIAVEIGAVQPAWQPWTPPPSSAHQAHVRGGYRWKLTVAPRTTTKLSAAYEVRIAGKHELVGGNRREP
jgi:Domain of unknown function (DUF4139)/N-terminal domain of unknown function (DUF4140)